MIKRKIRYFTLLSAVAAAVVYGGWAVYANYEHGVHAYTMAGCVQAVYAFFSTLSMTHVAQWYFFKCGGGILGVCVGFVVGFLVMLSIPVCVHIWVATPDILQTILPGLIWGSIYLLTFLFALNKTHTLAQKLKDRM